MAYKLDLGLRKRHIWNFMVADVSTPIIGANLLVELHLVPDLNKKCLIYGKTLLSAPCQIRESTQSSVHSISNHLNSKINKLLQKYPSLLKPPQYDANPPHDVEHHIETIGPLIYQKPRRLLPEIASELRTKFERQREISLIQHSKSQWASPVIPQKRRGKKLHIIGDSAWRI